MFESQGFGTDLEDARRFDGDQFHADVAEAVFGLVAEGLQDIPGGGRGLPREESDEDPDAVGAIGGADLAGCATEAGSGLGVDIRAIGEFRVGGIPGEDGLAQPGGSRVHPPPRDAFDEGERAKNEKERAHVFGAWCLVLGALRL